MPPIQITLGNHEINVVGQKHAYLLHQVPKFLAKLPGGASALIDAIDGDVDKAAVELPTFLGEHLYEALCLVIPGENGRPNGLKVQLPEWEFRGFATREAMEAGAYDPEYDNSPSFDEIVAAFKAAFEANDFKVFKPALDALNKEGGADPTRALSMISANSLSAKDGSAASMTSTTTPRTSTVNGA